MPPPDRRSRLPWPGLLALAMTGFVVVMTETLPAGLLTQIATGLNVSEAGAGQLIGVYALGTVVAAVPAITLTRRSRRRPLLLLGLGGNLVANVVTSVLGSYPVTLAVRFVAGAFAGLVWGLVPGYARRIVRPDQQGRALALASIGVPLGLSVGTPVGTWFGTLVGWRWSFVAMALLAGSIATWVVLRMPDAVGDTRTRRTSVSEVVRIPGVAPVLAVVVTWMLAHNILYTYVAPFVGATGLPVRVDVVLAVFGFSSIAGVWVTGLLVDAMLRRLVLLALTGFGLACAALGLHADVAPVLWTGVVVWGVTFGGSSTELNTAAADTTGEDTDVAAALISTVWNAAIFGGSAVGGLLLTGVGPQNLPWVGSVLVLTALVVATVARRHGFRPGPRHH